MTLGYVARGLVQMLGAHFIVSTLLSLAVALAWRGVAAAPTRASVTARRLFALRLLPSAGGLLTGLLVALGYALWESRAEHERVGVVALIAAAGGVVVAASASIGFLMTISCTSRIRRELVAAGRGTMPTRPLPASIIDTPFPVVAIVGLVASRLFVARSVVDACSSEEFEAVLAHEQAHARQHDNLRRLAMAAAPDVLGLCRSGRRLEAAWMQAAELAADEWAAARGDSGLHLASALVKVARLATPPVNPLPASALYRGEPITERVQRLLDPPATTDIRPWPAWARALTRAALVAAALASLSWLHAAAERLLLLGQ